jgi:hypothetical protein
MALATFASQSAVPGKVELVAEENLAFGNYAKLRAIVVVLPALHCLLAALY